MTAICMTCYVALLLVAVQFIRLRTTYFRMFVGIIIFEVVYFFAAALLAFVPGLGLSIAAANGVANGGLMFQFLILFPVWGPLLGRWATKTIDEPQPNDRSVYPEQEIARLSDWAWAAVNFVVLLAVAPFLIGVFWALYSPSTFPPFSFAWLLVLLSAANALLSVRYRRRRRRKKIERQREERRTRGLCPRCEYNLTGNVSGVCSECGEVIDG
ncbi:MAG: hypothetical protein JXA69_03975 [Phycisphaerae bacterium]|nr:hypothetical protein [Phycisphaerae bacterium]